MPKLAKTIWVCIAFDAFDKYVIKYVTAGETSDLALREMDELITADGDESNVEIETYPTDLITQLGS